MSKTTMERVSYGGWPDCVRLSNGVLELVATAAVGPRVLRFGFVGGQNLFREFEDQLGLTGGDDWRPYGGHRFWHAPEAKPRTFWPDNEPVEVHYDNGMLLLTQPLERSTGLQKQIEIELFSDRQVNVVHRLINRNLWAVTLAPWALSVLAQGGRAIVPQEPFKSHTENWLPARPLVLWTYTDMADPRWTWGSRYIQLRQDPGAQTFQKFGTANTRGWAAYVLGGEVFLKRYAFDPKATYADMGCNTEVFTNADMLELETLGPEVTLPPGGSVVHEEKWFLFKAEVGETDDAIDAALLPLVKQTERA